jgi:hypothetical protein
MKTSPFILKNILAKLDKLCLVLSPLALILFGITVIIILDGFGRHAQLLHDLDEDGMVVTGRWSGLSSNKEYASVQLDRPVNGFDRVFFPAKYYRQETLAGLKPNQPVPLRVILPPEHEQTFVLQNAYDEVRAYTGYLDANLWLLLLCWVILAIRPDILLFGLSYVFHTKQDTV